ncbi:GbsR/MarR family transcriptional regulator [Bacillaceae bacterium Marseille-Q3522]|nr:GbsR/MarR family transcriptional regulator [Bacillaceae bacterium Marseille-Q3522]
MDEKTIDIIEQVKEHIIEKIAENMNAFGMPSTVGRVLGIIYMNRKPMTLAELSEATGMSKTRMSQVVREMVDANIAEKVFEKGVRKDIYDVEQDYYQTFISLFTANWRKVVSKNKLVQKKWRKELQQALENDDLTPELEAKIYELLQETEEWMNYYNWLSRVIEFFESEEVFKHIPKIEEKGGN